MGIKACNEEIESVAYGQKKILSESVAAHFYVN